MRVLVMGAGGMLGHDVVRAAEFVNHEVTALDRGELDVTDERAVRDALESEAPEAVVNCAAFTDVDGAESDRETAAAVNERGAEIVAAAASAAGASVLYPSTDYVFDGRAGEPYVESSPPSPLSVYGATKLAGERATAEANPRHFVVRSSWLFGTAGRNFVESMLSLGVDHGEVLVVRDQVGSPTYTGHLADGLVRLLSTRAHGIHHLAGGGECSWYDFAREIFAQSGIACRVMSMTSDELTRPAPRPAYSVLDTERDPALLLPNWQDGLRSYLAERAGNEARGGLAADRA